MPMLKLPDRATGILPLVGAGLLLALAVALIRFAVATGGPGMQTKLSASDIRRSCASITESEFHAACLQQAYKAVRKQSMLGAIRDLPAVR